LAVRIIDTPEFQGLAGLRQVGFSDLVYEGSPSHSLSMKGSPARVLYLMLFDPNSKLAAVFHRAETRWIGDVPNDNLRRLIDVILNWKEKIEPPEGLEKLLDKEIEKAKRALRMKRPGRRWSALNCSGHAEFLRERLFIPFMRDVIGNTICSNTDLPSSTRTAFRRRVG
jgi:hypothetical protein